MWREKWGAVLKKRSSVRRFSSVHYSLRSDPSPLAQRQDSAMRGEALKLDEPLAFESFPRLIAWVCEARLGPWARVLGYSVGPG